MSAASRATQTTCRLTRQRPAQNTTRQKRPSHASSALTASDCEPLATQNSLSQLQSASICDSSSIFYLKRVGAARIPPFTSIHVAKDWDLSQSNRAALEANTQTKSHWVQDERLWKVFLIKRFVFTVQRLRLRCVSINLETENANRKCAYWKKNNNWINPHILQKKY